MSDPIVPGLTSVVIVAADSGPLLSVSIGSALASAAPVEVILVDNASQDGEVERAISAHSGDTRLRLLRNSSNLGFGPACNRGAAVARGDLFVFLNPDCELQSDTLEGVRKALDEDERIGLLGVTVCDAAGLPARGNRRRDPTLRRALMSMSGLARFETRWPTLAGVEMPPRRAASGVENVDAVSGACMTVRRRAFEAIGGFDEAYFLHAEDLDLCRRIRASGRCVAVAHDLCVRHAQGSSSRRRPLFVARHKHRGMWRYFRTFDPAARNPLLRAAVWSGIWAHFLVVALRYRLRGQD